MSNLAVFQRRLAEARRATQLPAAAQFDLASSSITDDELEYTQSIFGGTPYGESGFGMSDVLQDLFSRDPKSLPVESLAHTQRSLVAMGYADPSVPQDGQWSPYWNAAFRRSDRDAFEQVKAGKHWGAGTTQDFFRYLGYAVPQPLIKTLIGFSQGVVEQTKNAVTNLPEAFAEAGVGGGIAIGAGLGSVIPGVGTVLGGVVGGGLGLLGEIFGDDEEEPENREWYEELWDWVSPYEEYKATGAKHFTNLLGTVWMASGIVKSISVAKGMTTTALNQPRVSLSQAFSRATPSPTPGVIGNTLSKALKGQMRSGAAVGAVVNSFDELMMGDLSGAFGDALQGAAIGAVGAKVGGKVLGAGGRVVSRVAPAKARAMAIEGLRYAPLRRFQSSTVGQLAKAGYTGAVGTGISARLFGGIGPGETPIQREIAEAEELDFGLPGTILDWTVGLAVYPERILPWRAGDISRGFRNLATGHPMLPFTRATQARNPGMSFKEAESEAARMLGATDQGHSVATQGRRIQFAYLNKQVDTEAHRSLVGQTFPDTVAQEAAHTQARSKIIGQIFDEAKSEDIFGSPTARRLFDDALKDPVGMENYILGFEGNASGLEHFLEHDKASALLQTRARVVTEAKGKPVTFTPVLKDRYLTRQDYNDFADTYETRAKNYEDSFNAALDVPEPNPLTEQRGFAGQELDQTLTSMVERGVITELEAKALRPTIGVPVVDKSLLKRLRERAKTRPSEIPALTAELERAGLDRYKAISTGENMLFYDHIDSTLNALHIDNYTRHDRFHDMLASVTSKVDDLDQLGTARFTEIKKELDLAGSELNLERTGDQLANDIYNGWRQRYDPLVQAQRGEAVMPVAGTFIKRVGEKGTKFELFKVDPRDLTPSDLVEILNLDSYSHIDDPLQAARRLKRAVHDGASFGASWEKMVQAPVQQARTLARSLRMQGFQGFSDFMRTLRGPEGRFPEAARKFSVGRQLLDNTNAFWLPHSLHRVNMALRFSLNPTFDASRYVEQAAFGHYQGVPVRAAFRPGKFIQDENAEWLSLDGVGNVSGREALEQAYRITDEAVYHRRVWAGFDEMQFRNFNRGILMFAPRQAEAAATWWFVQKELKAGRSLNPKTLDDIREKVLKISRYGTGPSAAARSMHFVFFPFLFQAKHLAGLHDFMLGAPARNLLLHEGLRRWNTLIGDETVGERFSDELDQHLPFVKELSSKLNNLAFGISPGRFVLEGLADKTSAGQAAQILTSFFLPGGVHQPLASFAGAFAPVVATEDQDIEDVLSRVIPLYRDIDQFFVSTEERPGIVSQQITAFREGGAPYWQLEQYADARRELKEEALAPLEPAIIAAGYSSLDGFLRSEAGRPIAQAIDQMDLVNGETYPSGKTLYNQFENEAELKQQQLFALSNKDEKSVAEEAILSIGAIEQTVKNAAAQSGTVSQDDLLRRITPIIRQFALGYSSNRTFAALWDELFAFEYGPIRRTVAA